MKIAIIGAGLSGITAARTITSGLGQSNSISIFEKSRGAGGRMSTRRTDDFEFDHGAQYFTAKDARFKAAVERAFKDGFAAPWNGTAKYLKNGEYENDTGGQRYVSTPRMNSWIKSMAEGLDISTSARVSALSRAGERWDLLFEDGTRRDGFDFVIAAVPAPQAEALLSSAEFSALQAIKDAKMEACFAVMAGFDTEISLPWQTLRRDDGPASWIAVNSAKPGRPESGTTLMIHSGPAWSAENVDRDKTALQTEILKDVSALLGIDFSKAAYTTIHRWLYAAVSKGAGISCAADETKGLIACGDWCLGGRVEGAYLSGLAAGETVLGWR